jgi:catechol 2,3-dioxygenase-like lactoylglutathione lyase family enzyme
VANFFGATGITVTDIRRSIDFYTKILGMNVSDIFKQPYVDEVMLELAGSSSLLLMKGSATPDDRNAVKLVFYVSDIVAIVAQARIAGLRIVSAPQAALLRDGPLYSHVYDPDGYLVELLELN